MDRLPSIRPQELITALKRAGFVDHRQSGSHRCLRHPQTRRRTIVPIHSRDIKCPLLKEIIKQAGLFESQFRGLL